MKKHEAFETDCQVHRDRCDEIKKEGQRLIVEVSPLLLFYLVWIHHNLQSFQDHTIEWGGEIIHTSLKSLIY